MRRRSPGGGWRGSRTTARTQARRRRRRRGTAARGASAAGAAARPIARGVCAVRGSQPISEGAFLIVRFVAIIAVVCAAAISATVAPARAAPRMWFGLLDDQTFRWAPDRAQGWNDAAAAHTSV